MVKMTPRKKKIMIIGAALLLMFLMTASMFAGPFLQSFNDAEASEVELPTEKIIEYELTEEQENLLKLEGKTIVKFYHNLACDNCLEEKQWFESIVNIEEFSDQIVLEEITSNNTAELPSASVHSYIGQKFLPKGYTPEEVIDALCDVMIKPPVVCAVKDV